MAVLPQTNPQGGPNPNSAPQVGLSVNDLPGFGGTMDAALTGGARAAAIANMRSQAAATGTGLPAYNPAIVAPPAPGLSGAEGLALASSGGTLGAQDVGNSGQPGPAAMLAGQTQPSIGAAIHNWMWNEPGGPEATAYNARTAAGAIYARQDAANYLSANPSLVSAAQADPVRFATTLGPILDAAVAASNGTQTQGAVTHNTPDGPMVKSDSNVEHTNAVAKAFGVPVGHAHAMTQTQAYTLPEFLHATEGLPIGALKNMWEMQHYLNPNQQALSIALSTAASRAQQAGPGSDAEATYEQLSKIAGGVLPSMYGIQPAQPVK